MFTEEDLDAAVRDGDVTPTGAAAIRRSAAARLAAAGPAAPSPPAAADSAAEGERLRLVSGFHDVSVAGATLLTMASLAFFSAEAGVTGVSLILAAAAWGLAEHFTRARRLAFTSILLMLVFVAGAGAAASGLTGADPAWLAWLLLALVRGHADAAALAGIDMVPVTAALAGAALHWRRFRVPAAMGVAAGTAAVLAVVLLLRAAPAASAFVRALAFAAGLAVFAFAMRWDLSDPERRTVRSDVAFWLHLAAAPLLVGPAFAAIGAGMGAASAGTAAAAIVLYAAISLVALAIDRRALMASTLFYLLAAVGSLLVSKGHMMTIFPLTGLVVGPGLLLLSALWEPARRAVLAALPGRLASHLSPPARDPAASPAAAA